MFSDRETSILWLKFTTLCFYYFVTKLLVLAFRVFFFFCRNMTLDILDKWDEHDDSVFQFCDLDGK